MDRLDNRLLASSGESWQLPPGLYSNWKALGSYHPLRFVVRLRPDVHRALESFDAAGSTPSGTQPEHIQAFSTYFHETIHWWQHIGSTLGLLLSLLHPAQTHFNKERLDRIARGAPWKSLRKYNQKTAESAAAGGALDENVNVVLNNWHDIEFFRHLVCEPLRAEQYVNDPYFDCLAHSFRIASSAVLWLLSSTCDPQLAVLPDPRKWDSEFLRLRDQHEEGFYFRSPVRLPPLGARALFEGQARFCQIQYLYAASDSQLSWETLERAGMLSGIYREAFDAFLAITGAAWPNTPGDSLVGLFLLILDLSINPSDAFPFDLVHVPSVVQSIDPGMRFLMLCQFVATDGQSLLGAITRYSRDEYLEVCARLCKAIVCEPPVRIAETVVSWCKTHPPMRDLLSEDDSFAFAPGNLPVKILFSRFLRFQHDRLTTPEFFCWPGIFSAERPGAWTVDAAKQLFSRHEALFIDRPDGDIYPRALPGKDEATVSRTFNAFYASIAAYELTRQWLVQEGPFDFDFLWLTSQYPQFQVKEWASHYFQQAFGIPPDAIRIL